MITYLRTVSRIHEFGFEKRCRMQTSWILMDSKSCLTSSSTRNQTSIKLTQACFTLNCLKTAQQRIFSDICFLDQFLRPITVSICGQQVPRIGQSKQDLSTFYEK